MQKGLLISDQLSSYRRVGLLFLRLSLLRGPFLFLFCFRTPQIISRDDKHGQPAKKEFVRIGLDPV